MLTKIMAFLKSIPLWAKIAIGFLLIFGLLRIRENYWSNRNQRDTGVLNTLLKTEKDNRKIAEEAITKLDDNLKKSEEQRVKDKKESDKKIADLEADNNKLSVDNEKYKQGLSELTNDQVVKDFEKYIGEKQIAWLAIGHFSLTRPGAEKSLGLFRDGASAAQQYANEKKALKECKDAGEKADKSYKESLADDNKKFNLVTGELTDCRKSSEGKDKTIKDLKHKVFWKNLEAWIERGFVIGGVYFLLKR